MCARACDVAVPRSTPRSTPDTFRSGAAEAVPKRILDAMNVEGLTRENVASHLQARPPASKRCAPCNWLCCRRRCLPWGLSSTRRVHTSSLTAPFWRPGHGQRHRDVRRGPCLQRLLASLTYGILRRAEVSPGLG